MPLIVYIITYYVPYNVTLSNTKQLYASSGGHYHSIKEVPEQTFNHVRKDYLFIRGEVSGVTFFSDVFIYILKVK